MEIIFKVLAVVLLVIAAILFWRSNSEFAFAAGVLSACAYLLSIRFQLKARINQREAEARDREDPTE